MTKMYFLLENMSACVKNNNTGSAVQLRIGAEYLFIEAGSLRRLYQDQVISFFSNK